MIKVCVFVVFMFCQRLFRSLVLGFEAVTWDVSEGVYLDKMCQLGVTFWCFGLINVYLSLSHLSYYFKSCKVYIDYVVMLKDGFILSNVDD